METFFKKIFNLSMLWKFTIIYFLIIMVPTMFIGINNYRQSVDSIKEQSDRNMSQKISQLKQNIIYTTQNAENIAEEIVFTTELQGFLDSDFTFTQKQVDFFIYNLQNKLINIKHLYPNKYFKIRIFTSNKSTKEAYDLLYSIDRIKNKNYYREIEDSKNLKFWGRFKKAEEYYDLTENINPKQNNNMVIPLYKRISPVISDELIGVIEIDILNEKMFGELSELQVGKNGYLIVMDRYGEIISPIDENSPVKQMSLNMLPGENGVKEFVINRERYRMEYDTVNETGFKILSIVPEKELLGQVTSYRNTLICTIIIGITAIFFITYLTTYFLFARLKVLIKMMKRVQSGEFEVRIDDSKKDEVGELAFSFNQMAAKLEETMLNLIGQETAHRDAEIRALQSQINPHFLFNTLEGLRMECEIREEYDLANVLTSLGRLFRYNIKWINGLVPLRQEIEHINNYITIMRVRFRDKFNLSIDIPEELLDCLVIKMMMQPLVENSFYHAFKNKEGIWEIKIRGSIQGDDLVIEIKDNGLGMDNQRLDKINRGLSSGDSNEIDKKTEGSIGLWNVDTRIKMQFGEEYGIKLKSERDLGTTVIITLPVNYRRTLPEREDSNVQTVVD
jgi:two-component system sensor histidine kinase YesM